MIFAHKLLEKLLGFFSSLKKSYSKCKEYGLIVPEASPVLKSIDFALYVITELRRSSLIFFRCDNDANLSHMKILSEIGSVKRNIGKGKGE